MCDNCTFHIYGSHQGDTEEIDSFSSEEEANDMLDEYQLAYGSNWVLWIEKK